MTFLETLMEYASAIADIFMIIVLLDILALFVMMFLERYDPRVFLTWLIVLVMLPPVGLILYMYMGSTIYNRMRFRPKNVTDAQLMQATELQSDMLERDFTEHPDCREVHSIAKALEEAGAWSYSRGNDVTLFTEGNEKLTSMFEDLRAAKKSILIEYYIIRNDRVGNILMDILIQKVREGVEVRLLTDAFGIGKGPKQGIYRFRNAGGHYATFHSLLTLMFSPKKNHRNHRKIAIIDGRIGYCGGFNIGDEYQGEGPLGHWRDASVRVVGPAIVSLAVRFSADWQYCAPQDRMGQIDDYLDPSVFDDMDGGVRMQLVSGGPDSMPNNPVHVQYLTMISRAKERVYITTPYLVPDESMLVALSNAARAGVDVRILIPDKKDHMFVYWNNLTFSNELMKAGVRVWRYKDGFIHEKMLLADDICCSVGSANFDHRSLALNFETNVMMYSRSMNAQAADRFLRDLEDSEEYTFEQFEQRTTKMRIRMAISRQLILLA